MALPAWGIAILVLYPLLQIPAVLLLARYCEVDVADLPTPPMRAFWTDGASTDDDTATGEDTPGGGAVPDSDPGIAAGVVRCDNCGRRNDPSFGRCRNCVAPL